jgi:hypothetical protein
MKEAVRAGFAAALALTLSAVAVAAAVHNTQKKRIRVRRGDVRRILGASELSQLDCVSAFLEVRGGLSAFQNQWITKGKANFPILKLTEANHLMVTEWLVREMKAANVRDHWASECIPVIAMGILIPSRRCVESYAALHHPDVQDRLLQHRENQFTSRTWSQWALKPVEVLTGASFTPILLRQS